MSIPKRLTKETLPMLVRTVMESDDFDMDYKKQILASAVEPVGYSVGDIIQGDSEPEEECCCSDNCKCHNSLNSPNNHPEELERVDFNETGIPKPGVTINPPEEASITSDRMVRFAAMNIINQYLMLHLPCLVVVDVAAGFYCITHDITYEMVMRAAKDDFDCVFYTDGVHATVLRDNCNLSD